MIIGAIKIKDGLFIGDEHASQDREFINTNKVTHMINCAATQLPSNILSIQYLQLEWEERDDQILFDGSTLDEIYQFIEQSNQLGESCLVHSVKGQSRSSCALAAYFMKKYSWTLYKTLEYLNSRRPDLEIRASFFFQLNKLECQLAQQEGNKRTASWNEYQEKHPHSAEELILRNTFLNSQNAPIDDVYINPESKLNVLTKAYSQKLKWKDLYEKDNSNQLATIVFSGSPDYIPIRDILKQQGSQPILKKNNIPQYICKIKQIANEESNYEQYSCYQQIESQQISNNPSLQNLMQKCQQSKMAQKAKRPTPIKKSVAQQQKTQNEDKSQSQQRSNSQKNQKQQKTESQAPNFADFKNQVQQSLNYFNKNQENKKSNTPLNNEFTKILKQSISQLQSSYQRFQQLQSNKQQGKNKTRPNSGEKGNESNSPYKTLQRPLKGPPIQQSNSQLYLRTVSNRRQASSTLRNKPGHIINYSLNQNNNNSFTATQVEQEKSMKQIHDLTQIKKLLSSKSVTNFSSKNQAIKVVDKPHSTKQKQNNDPTQQFLILQKPQNGVRTFSPGLKQSPQIKNGNQANSVRQKLRNQSPGQATQGTLKNNWI